MKGRKKMENKTITITEEQFKEAIIKANEE